jgi:hypothetical protein
MKVIGAAHPTHASAETALKADKTCMPAGVQGGLSVRQNDRPARIKAPGHLSPLRTRKRTWIIRVGQSQLGFNSASGISP